MAEFRSSALPAATAPPGAEATAAGDSTPVYKPRVDGRSCFVSLRGVRYHLRIWDAGTGPAEGGVPTLLLLHGWMDVSASFQFVVDALKGRWRVVAPDWRGFGLSEASPGRPRADSYAFADYLGDLDALLDQLSPREPVRVAAHSMGGNIAMLYAGIRPHRMAGVVNLEGFGLPETDPANAVARYRRWLDDLKQPASLRPFASLDEVAARLIRNNPRLPADKARFLASHWAQPLQRAQQSEAHGGIDELAGEAPRGPDEMTNAAAYVLRADPAHKRINPVPYRVDEALSCWAAIEAPVLWVASRDRNAFHEFTRSDAYRRRLASIKRLEEVEVADAGHMLHHDQPGFIAGLIEDFFSR